MALPVWDALRRGEAPDLLTLAQKASSGAVTFHAVSYTHLTLPTSDLV